MLASILSIIMLLAPTWVMLGSFHNVSYEVAVETKGNIGSVKNVVLTGDYKDYYRIAQWRYDCDSRDTVVMLNFKDFNPKGELMKESDEKESLEVEKGSFASQAMRIWCGDSAE